MTGQLNLFSWLKVTSLTVTLIGILCFGSFCFGQGQRPPEPPRQPQQQEKQPEEAWEIQRKQELIKRENLKRQLEIKKDTDALLTLATELKQYVDKTNENTLSLDVIKKAEQIEKLAKTVREKMKGPS